MYMCNMLLTSLSSLLFYMTSPFVLQTRRSSITVSHSMTLQSCQQDWPLQASVKLCPTAGFLLLV